MKSSKKIFLLPLLFILNFSYAQHTKLLDFTGTANGAYPLGSLISDGTFLYGMTSGGGTNSLGTIFKIMPNGTGYVKLIDFAGTPNGGNPWGSLLSDGTYLYGMTIAGTGTTVTTGCGTLFKIMPDGTGYIKLMDFDSINGCVPQGSLISDGIYLYGMTTGGGINGMGLIFKIKPDGTGYSKLFEFSTAQNGNLPYGSLISDGTFLYGMTTYGGGNGMGVIFRITLNGTGYVKLLSFTGTNGANPSGSLISDGTFLFGMTELGGTNNTGVLFKIKPDGTGYVTLMEFTGAANGSYPKGALVSDGTYLYGMTKSGGTSDAGVLFKIKPDGTGYVKLLDFVGTANGSMPYGSLISVGTFLYGMTTIGGTNDMGTIFKFGSINGISENNAKTNLKIYPNPVTNKLNITSTGFDLQNFSLQIINSLGELIYSQDLISNQNEIELSNYQPGIYFLKIQNGSGQKIFKIIKH